MAAEILLLIIVAAVSVGVFGLAALTARGRLSVRIAVRGARRRPGQTFLVVMGLSLAALLFSASFSLEGALHHAMRAQQTAPFGNVDAVITPEAAGSATEDDEDDEAGDRRTANGTELLDTDDADDVRSALDGADAEVTPLLTLPIPVVHERTERGDPGLPVVGLPRADGISELVDTEGEPLSHDDLGDDGILISSTAAEELRATRGDRLVIAGTREVSVIGVYESGAPLAPAASAVLPLRRLQELADADGAATAFAVSYGDTVDWAPEDDPVEQDLDRLLQDRDWEVDPLRAQAHESADRLTSELATLFLLFSQLSMVAGVLLIVLVVMMLAAERQREFAVMRALGMKHGGLSLALTLEGILYAVLASAAGTLLGWLAGVGAARLLSDQVADPSMGALPPVRFDFDAQMLASAYSIGAGVIIVVFALAATRASRVDIVSALRGQPAPVRRRGWVVPVLAVIVLLCGMATAVLGFQNGSAPESLAGLSLTIAALAPLLTRLRVPRRLVNIVAPAGIIVLWALPGETFGDAGTGVTLFFLAGIVLVSAGVWLFVANSDLLQRLLRRVLSPIPALTFVVPIAVAYSMRNRVQAGMTVAMLSIVVLTITLSGFVTTAVNQVYADHRSVTGGFDIQAERVAGEGRPPLLREVLAAGDEVDTADVAAVGGYARIDARVSQVDAESGAEEATVWGVDDDYLLANRYPVFLRGPGLESSEAVWDELRRSPNTAVVSGSLIPSDSAAFVGGGGTDLELEGVGVLDEELPANLRLRVTDPETDRTRTLRVIGVVDRSAEYIGDVVTSTAGLENVTGEDAAPDHWFLAAEDGEAVGALEVDVRRALLAEGVTTTQLADEVDFRARSNGVVQTLLVTFMGFGLIVGCAALGVVSIRSITERRGQIGVLRAIGMPRGAVRRLFLIESLLVTLTGVALGVGLGFAVSPGLIDSLQEDLPGVQYVVPVGILLGTVGVTVVFSMLVSVLTSHRAGNVPPVEALREQS